MNQNQLMRTTLHDNANESDDDVEYGHNNDDLNAEPEDEQDTEKYQKIETEPLDEKT